MILWIFINVENLEVDEEQCWNEAQCRAIYRAMCQNEAKDVNRVHSDIQEYVDEWCKGKRLDFRFEHSSADKLPINDTVASAKKLYNFLKKECMSVGLTVNWNDGV